MITTIESQATGTVPAILLQGMGGNGCLRQTNGATGTVRSLAAGTGPKIRFRRGMPGNGGRAERTNCGTIGTLADGGNCSACAPGGDWTASWCGG